MRNLYAIYMLRDPRDMVVSRHGADAKRYWASLKYWKTYTPYARRLDSHSRFIMVRYEDLVAQPDAVQAHLMERMPFLVSRGPFSQYHELAQPSEAAMKALRGVRPVSSASVGSWRKHLPRVVGQLQRHGSITEDLIAYGYEEDDTWERELEGIEPDLEASHWPEHFSKQVLRKQRRGRYLMAAWAVLVHSKWGLPLGRVCRAMYMRSSLLSGFLSDGEESVPSTKGMGKAGVG